MNYLKSSILLLLIIACASISYSQKITTGGFSGVNISDIHGQVTGGKWSPNPGPAEGIYLGYSFNKSLGVRTGIGFSTTYYSYKSPSYAPGIYDLTLSSQFPGMASQLYYWGNISMDFRFLRIPLLFTVTVPNVLQFEMHAGIYLSFLNGYNLNNYYYDDMNKPAKHDFGYLFSSTISYPLSDKFKATFNAGYLTGRREFSNYRHGSSEFTLGVAYSWLIKNKKPGNTLMNENDSSSKRVNVTLTGGLNYSWNRGNEPNGTYYGYAGPSLGFALKFPIGSGAAFQTGFSFERKGYSIKDSSISFYRLVRDEQQLYYVNTKIQIDYAVVPALLTLPLGKPGRLYLSTGPWLALKLNARTVGVAYNDYHTGTSYQLKKTTVYDDLEKSIKNYDLGWIFGCEVLIPVVKNYEIELALQYSTGFRDVFDSSGILAQVNPYDPQLIIKNRTISLHLGFRIPSTNN